MDAIEGDLSSDSELDGVAEDFIGDIYNNFEGELNDDEIDAGEAAFMIGYSEG